MTTVKQILAKADIAQLLDDAAGLKDDTTTGAILVLLQDDGSRTEYTYFTTAMPDETLLYALELLKNKILNGGI